MGFLVLRILKLNSTTHHQQQLQTPFPDFLIQSKGYSMIRTYKNKITVSSNTK